MARLKHVKNLKTGNSNVFDLLVSFVFGKVNLDIYRPQKTYYEGNTIIRLNESTGKYEVLRCLETTTGTFNASKWRNDNVHDSTNSQFIDSYTILGKTNPNNTMNRIWFQNIKSKGTIDTDSFLT